MKIYWASKLRTRFTCVPYDHVPTGPPVSENFPAEYLNNWYDDSLIDKSVDCRVPDYPQSTIFTVIRSRKWRNESHVTCQCCAFHHVAALCWVYVNLLITGKSISVKARRVSLETSESQFQRLRESSWEQSSRLKSHFGSSCLITSFPNEVFICF